MHIFFAVCDRGQKYFFDCFVIMLIMRDKNFWIISYLTFFMNWVDGNGACPAVFFEQELP